MERVPGIRALPAQTLPCKSPLHLTALSCVSGCVPGAESHGLTLPCDTRRARARWRRGVPLHRKQLPPSQLHSASSLQPKPLPSMGFPMHSCSPACTALPCCSSLPIAMQELRTRSGPTCRAPPPLGPSAMELGLSSCSSHRLPPPDLAAHAAGHGPCAHRRAVEPLALGTFALGPRAQAATCESLSTRATHSMLRQHPRRRCPSAPRWPHVAMARPSPEP